MSKNEVIEKIQKLLALSKSTNEHEAALAMERAGALLAKYELEMMDVLAKEKGEATSISMIEEALLEEYGQGNYRWEGRLVSVLVKTFECSAVRGARDKKFHVFGTKTDLELLIHFFRFLRMRIYSDTRGLLKVEAFSYAVGLMNTISDRLDAIYAKKKEALKVDNSAVRDLVIFKKKFAEDAMQKAFPRRTKSNSRITTDHDYFMKGSAAGKRVPLSRPIEGGKSPSQIH